MGDLQSPAPAPPVLPHISGVVHGGQQPISGATIQLYAANMTANLGLSAAMISSTVTTASDGSFNITNLYSCPTAPVTNPLVYLVATGGNPGLQPSTVYNGNIALMAVLGTCSTLSSTSYIVINELTTVAAVEALSSFMTDYAHMGESPTNPAAMIAAFNQANSEVSFSTGSIGSSSLDIPKLEINTLGNILAACVNTGGGTSGDGSACGNLLAWTGTTTDTVAAALAMVESPGNNAASLYGLITATSPFQPYFTSVPSDFTASTGFAYPANIKTAALDSNGHIWVYTGGYTYNTVTNTSTDVEGVITVYDNNFNYLFTISPPNGGLYYPTSMAADTSGDVFVTNANNTISEFNSSGTPLSPSGGWSTGITASFTGTQTGVVGYATNSQQAGPATVDSLGNIWGKAPFGASPCYFEMNHLGTVITPSGAATGYCATMLGLSDFGKTDGSGNAWGTGLTAIGEVNSTGGLAASAPTSAGCFYPSFDATSTTADEVTESTLYDHVHNHLWGVSYTGAGTITDTGSANFCNQGSTAMPVIPIYTNSNTTQGQPYSAGSLIIINAVLDGAGNLWFTTGGVALSGTVGSSSTQFTGTATFSSWLGEISPTGTVLSPFNPAMGIYGYQPAGFGVNATAAVNNAAVTGADATVALLGVDVSGNIWALDIVTNKILKISGKAIANTSNY